MFRKIKVTTTVKESHDESNKKNKIFTRILDFLMLLPKLILYFIKKGLPF